MNDWSTVILTQRAKQAVSGLGCDAGGRPFNKSYVSRRFKFYTRKAGLSENARFHGLRHSFASILVQGGESIFKVSRLMGHTSVGTTEKFYAHLSPETMHDVVETITVPEN